MKFYYSPLDRIMYSEKTVPEEIKRHTRQFSQSYSSAVKEFAVSFENEEELLSSYDRKDEWCMVANGDKKTYRAIKLPFVDNLLSYYKEMGYTKIYMNDGKDAAAFSLIHEEGDGEHVPIDEAISRLDTLFTSEEHRGYNKIEPLKKGGWQIEFAIEKDNDESDYMWILMIDHFEI